MEMARLVGDYDKLIRCLKYHSLPTSLDDGLQISWLDYHIYKVYRVRGNDWILNTKLFNFRPICDGIGEWI